MSRARGPRWWPRTAAALTATALVALLAVSSVTSVASASRLDVRVPATGTATVARCTSTPVEVSWSADPVDEVEIGGWSTLDRAACTGRTMRVALVDASGVTLASGQGEVGDDVTLAAPPAASTVAAAIVSVGTFAVPTGVRPAVVPPGHLDCTVPGGSDTCTATIVNETSWPDGQYRSGQVWIGRTTGSGAPADVEVTLDVREFWSFVPAQWQWWASGMRVQGCGTALVTVFVPAAVHDVTLQAFGNPAAAGRCTP